MVAFGSRGSDIREDASRIEDTGARRGGRRERCVSREMERCDYCRSLRDGGAEGAGVVVRKSNDTTRRKNRTRRARLSRDEGDRRG